MSDTLALSDGLDGADERPPVVGLGASAGGVAALRSFFQHTPPDTGLAYVVILHLSPEHESLLPAILQQVTDMPVYQVQAPVPVAPNAVYVISPAKHLSMSDGHLTLSEPERPLGQRVAIDLFFRTLAETCGRSATAVVLSGAGSDGALGITRVKEEGGITIAQDPSEAEYDSMPRSAIATGQVDVVLPVAQMPGQILSYYQQAERIRLPSNAAQGDEDNDALRELFVLLRVRTGHDFASYKRATMLRRIGRRLQVNSVADLPTYLQVLRERPDEIQALLRDLLISVTNFFRDPETFAALDALLPQIFAAKQPDDQIRAWVAGCASGEEAYSVAILLREHAARQAQPPAIQVFATDIDEEAIAVAREGLYPDNIVADVSPERLQRFFTEERGRYRIKKEIRDLVLFAPHNVLRDPPFSRLDLVTCRNLLIYLNREVQERVLEVFHFVLYPGGKLLLGTSESADGLPGLFTVVDKKHRIYSRRTVTRLAPMLPALPLAAQEPPRPAAVSSSAPQATSFAELHQRLIASYGHPSVLVDSDYTIVHLAGEVDRFLRFASGEPSYNLLKVVHPDLRLELRTVLFEAAQQAVPSSVSRVHMRVGQEARLVNLLVQPVLDPTGARGFLWVLFTDVGAADEQPSRDAGLGAEPMVRRLDEELQRMREQLRLTIEQYETSNEELKASNEELQAMNEELRSTSEELETSKEELQSVNEELITVNQELKNKVDEISRVNSDLQNLMAASDIGTIFLDRELRVTRYTPHVEGLFNLIPTDINRPLAHVTHDLLYDRLLADAARVLERLVSLEREVAHRDGRWFLMRLLPYRTIEDRIDGVIITFVDMTARKQAEETLRQAHDELERQLQERTAALEAANAALQAEVAALRAQLT
jgi:two-component system CheB/CheR fusion protein